MSEKIQAMREIADWVKEFGWNPYFNQKNSDAYPIFHAETNSKPDLLLKKNGYNILVEVKTGQRHQDILNGLDQIWNYVGEYFSGRARYKLDEKILTIHAFVLATQYSRSGYLYSHEDNLNYLEYHNPYLTQNINMIEKPITHSTTRFMWRQWDSGLIFKHFLKLRQGTPEPTLQLPMKPRVGTLLAKTFATTRQLTTAPYLYLNTNIFASMAYDTIFAFDNSLDNSVTGA